MRSFVTRRAIELEKFPRLNKQGKKLEYKLANACAILFPKEETKL